MTEQQIIKKFSEEYQNEKFDFEGERCEVVDVLDKKIVIFGFAKMSGNFGEFIVIDAKIENKRIQFLIGSSVVIQQLEKVKIDNNFPIEATITKRYSAKNKRDYYTLS